MAGTRALWSHELKDKPVAKTFLNEKIVLFRNAGGDVGALEDCCCHRAAPLSLGEVTGEYLACGYHGLKFDVDGQMRRDSRSDPGPVRRQGAQLSGCGKMERRVDLDGRSGESGAR